ncbi:MAG: copper resistance protein NlpE [Lysobacter sp.]|jgi:copper homeostasis protein (lipoprotein)|nr:copper resistance protein NlpE [Lysobacter sp.]
MNRILTPLAIAVLAVSVTACKQEATPAAAPTATVEPAPAPVPEMTPQASDSDLAAKAGAIDMKVFPGTFSGTLPCASCPGIDTRLELMADGPFKLTETYQGEAGQPAVTEGSWTVEDGGKRVLLDPNSKSEQDRSYEIVSNDEIRLLGQDGKPVDSQLNYSLKRQAK